VANSGYDVVIIGSGTACRRYQSLAERRKDGLRRLSRRSLRKDGCGNLRAAACAAVSQWRLKKWRRSKASDCQSERRPNRVRGFEKDGEIRSVRAPIVVFAAGAVRSAALLLGSREGGLANRSGAVGRYFMNHNTAGIIAIGPRFVNDSAYLKTFGFNDFYLSNGRSGPPLGNVQLLGRLQ
jgi:choline dehydrogenase-like flavoprotein